MRRRRMGTSGLSVSRLALGTMTWGRSTDYETAAEQLRTFLSSGRFDPTPVITHQFPLEGIHEALDAIATGAAGKVILEIGD